jgi:hypothetical protein
VSGPTFPAQIWHLFMTDALGAAPAVDFPQPRSLPVWQTFHGQYEYSGAPATTSSTTTSDNSTISTDEQTTTTP